MVWGVSVCHNPLGPPCKPVDYRYSRSTACIVNPLCEVCASNEICSLSVSLSL
jgi:hypothetical protein